MLHFANINELHRYTKYTELSNLEDFHIFKMENCGKDFIRIMPPYTQDFYQIGIQSKMIETTFHLNQVSYTNHHNLMYALAVGQINSWVVNTLNHGFIIYFKKSFIHPLVKDPDLRFPYLKIENTALIELEDALFDQIIPFFTLLRQVYESDSSNKQEILKHQLTALLYQCNSIFKLNTTTYTRVIHQAEAFKKLVNKLYLSKKRVEEYASMLHLTPNYLSKIIKEVYHKSPKEIIAERTLLEAQTLLRYSPMDVAQIAYHLGFEEATYFGRFFKNFTGVSPGVWRKDNPL